MGCKQATVFAIWKRHYKYSAWHVCALTLSSWQPCEPHTSKAAITLHFYMLSYALHAFHMLSYTFIRFHTLSYAFKCFHMLSYAFISMLSYAFIRIIYALIRFYMHSTCYNMLLKAKVSQEMMLALCITGFCFAEAGKKVGLRQFLLVSWFRTVLSAAHGAFIMGKTSSQMCT